MTATEAQIGATQDTDTTSDYLAAFDAMMKSRTPEQAAEMARINAAAHCNQTICNQAIQGEQAEAEAQHKAAMADHNLRTQLIQARNMGDISQADYSRLLQEGRAKIETRLAAAAYQSEAAGMTAGRDFLA